MKTYISVVIVFVTFSSCSACYGQQVQLSEDQISPTQRKLEQERIEQNAKAERVEIIAKHKKDSTFLAHANAYINKKLDSEFVKENLKFVHLYTDGLTVAIYETITTKNSEGRNTIILYFKRGTNQVDTTLSVLNREEILKSIRGDSICKLYIGIEKAAEIAKKAIRTEEGIKYWDTGIMNILPKQIPKWSFIANYSPRNSAYNRMTEININMVDGKHETSYGFSQP